MAAILVNLATIPSSGGVRRVTYNGRQYLVAPLSLIVPGVLPGSRGALFYPPDEIAKNVRQWERIPLTLYHPTDPVSNGHLSATEPNVLRRQGIGFVSRPHMNGKLSAEGWFDVAKLREADRTYGTNTLNRLEAGEKIELSTGLYTDNEEAENGATCPTTGRPYTHIARNYRADHVAVLPDQMGACSVSDGCGVNNQSSADPQCPT